MAIQAASHTSSHEMYKVFNMGHRMEIYLHPSQVDTVISVANSFNITAQQIGYTEPAEHNHLWLTDTNGDQQTYQ